MDDTQLTWLDLSQREKRVTEHLADIGLDVYVLKVLVCERVVQTQRGVQTDGHPYAVSDPGQLPDLALPSRVSVKRFLQRGMEKVKKEMGRKESGNRARHLFCGGICHDLYGSSGQKRHKTSTVSDFYDGVWNGISFNMVIYCSVSQVTDNQKECLLMVSWCNDVDPASQK